jgi:tetratricopeptide (TPR) repeat protein
MFLFQELCRTFVLAKRESQALPWCQIAVDVQGNAWNLIYLGIAQIDLEELSIPLNTFLRAYSLSDTKETYFEVTKLLGQVYLKRGEFERAVGEYEKALASGGENNQWIHLGLAQALGQLGTWKEACQHLKRAMELGYSEYANTPFFSGRCEDH